MIDVEIQFSFSEDEGKAVMEYFGRHGTRPTRVDLEAFVRRVVSMKLTQLAAERDEASHG